MNSYEIHFTVHNIMTTFAEVTVAEDIDRVEFRKILNQRLIDNGFAFGTTVDEMFMILER